MCWFWCTSGKFVRTLDPMGQILAWAYTLKHKFHVGFYKGHILSFLVPCDLPTLKSLTFVSFHLFPAAPTSCRNEVLVSTQMRYPFSWTLWRSTFRSVKMTGSWSNECMAVTSPKQVGPGRVLNASLFSFMAPRSPQAIQSAPTMSNEQSIVTFLLYCTNNLMFHYCADTMVPVEYSRKKVL